MLDPGHFIINIIIKGAENIPTSSVDRIRRSCQIKRIKGKLNQNSVLSGSLSFTKYRVTFSKNDKFGQKITKNTNNVKFVTKKTPNTVTLCTRPYF